MKRIAIFQEDLSVGGIQKSLINLLNSLDYDKYDVELFLLKDENFYQAQLPSQIKLHYLNMPSGYFRFMPYGIMRSLKGGMFKQYGHYDIAIDFNSYQIGCAVGATCVDADRHIQWIHNDVGVNYAEESHYRMLWSLFKGKFKYLDEFVAVSAGLAQPFRELAKTGDKRIWVVNNFIDTDEIAEKSALETDIKVDPDCFNIVALGKLCHQKGYDIMLEQFKRLHDVRPEARLYVIGDGPDKDSLTELRDSLGLSDSAHFIGKRSNPYPYLHMMDAFLSTSRYEGQPLNIMEAKSVGLPIYMTKNLEKYCPGIPGMDDPASALAQASRTENVFDPLLEYNNNIREQLDAVLEA